MYKAPPVRPLISLARIAAGLVAAAAVSPILAAGPAPSLSQAQARYQQERAACLAGATGQAQSTCLKDAAAALAEARRGSLDGVPSAQYQANALERCRPLPDADRAACEARMRGAGTTSGSVEGGGIYRELVVRSVGSPASAAQAGSAGGAMGSGTQPIETPPSGTPAGMPPAPTLPGANVPSGPRPVR